jgi:hypothetical protein
MQLRRNFGCLYMELIPLYTITKESDKIVYCIGL